MLKSQELNRLFVLSEGGGGIEETVALCTMQGWAVTIDPVLLVWLLYQEKPISSSQMQQQSGTTSHVLSSFDSRMPRPHSEVTLGSDVTLSKLLALSLGNDICV